MAAYIFRVKIYDTLDEVKAEGFGRESKVTVVNRDKEMEEEDEEKEKEEEEVEVKKDEKEEDVEEE